MIALALLAVLHPVIATTLEGEPVAPNTDNDNDSPRLKISSRTLIIIVSVATGLIILYWLASVFLFA